MADNDNPLPLWDLHWSDIATGVHRPFVDVVGDDNTKRATRCLQAVCSRYDKTGAVDAITEILGDLRHLCDLMGWEYHTIDKVAHDLYTAEVMRTKPAKHDKLREAVIRDL